MSLTVKTLSYQLSLDDKNLPEPEWKTQVERWYQIDSPAYALCELYWQKKEDLNFNLGLKPDAILLNSPQASFKTDQAFCKTLSPSKFVHTLPNVRSSSLLQLAQWSGPLYSFVDPWEKVLQQAQDFLHLKTYQRLWVINVLEYPDLQVNWQIFSNEEA